MIRRNVGTICGLGLLIAAACTGGGSPNDFGIGPSDDAPTAPGAPSDPNAPPPNREDPPFGDQPPGGSGIPGTGSGTIDCRRICMDAIAVGCDQNQGQCESTCSRIPGSCQGLFGAYARCLIENQCDEDLLEECIDELEDLDRCMDGVDPDPPDGEAGRGGF